MISHYPRLVITVVCACGFCSGCSQTDLIAPLSGEQAALHFTKVQATDSAGHSPKEYRPLIAQVVNRSQRNSPGGITVRNTASAVDQNKPKSATPLVDSAQPSSTRQNQKKATERYLAATNVRSVA